MTKLLEKHDVDIRRTKVEYKHTHTAFVKTLIKEQTKQLFRYIYAHKLQDPEKVLAIYFKNLNSFVNDTNSFEF